MLLGRLTIELATCFYDVPVRSQASRLRPWGLLEVSVSTAIDQRGFPGKAGVEGISARPGGRSFAHARCADTGDERSRAVGDLS